MLSAEQIRDGWFNHIRTEEENFLWVSNQTAFDLMLKGVLPPETSDPENNENYMMIDAQLNTIQGVNGKRAVMPFIRGIR